jgi:hypothetical protein
MLNVTFAENANQLAFVVPFIGDLPSYTSLFFRSVASNKCIDVLLFVDREPVLNVPANVHVRVISRAGILERIFSSTGLELAEITGHKLCDFKPFYSSIFSEELKPYRWWGHCDIDLMFGDLAPWLDQRLSSAYDVVTAGPDSTVGHFTIYKNDNVVTSEMRMMIENPTYKNILLHPDSSLIDEWGAFEHIYSRRRLRIHQTPILQDAIACNFAPLGITFTPNGSIACIKPQEFGVAYWKDGHTWYESPRRKPVEVLYIHFMGNKTWWHWFFLRPNSYSRRLHVFSPIGYGLINDVQGMASIQYKLIRILQALLEFAKVKAGIILRRILNPSAFRRFRRSITPSGRYK